MNQIALWGKAAVSDKRETCFEKLSFDVSKIFRRNCFVKIFKLSAFAVLNATFFAACGDDVTKVTEVSK